MCLSLQIEFKAFVKGLYNYKLAERIIEEENKIHLGTLAESRIVFLEFDEHLKMVRRIKE